MKNSTVYEGNKRALIATILLIVIIFSASYAFFSSYNNAKATFSGSLSNALNVTYTLTAGQNINFDLDPSSFTQSNIDDALVKTYSSTDTVSLTNSSSYTDLMCSYEIYYEPTTVFNNSSSNTSGETELAILFKNLDDEVTNVIFDLNGITQKTKVASVNIETNSENSSKTHNWEYSILHYNRDFNQAEHMGKTFGGKITFKNTGCTEEVADDMLYNAILADNTAYADNVASENVSASTGIDFSSIGYSGSGNGNGLYYTSTNTEGNNRTYYYRGSSLNNYVKFGKYKSDYTVYRGRKNNYNYTYQDFATLAECNASDYNYNCQAVKIASAGDDMYWNIVRINEDGSFRLLYVGNSTTISSIGYSQFNQSAGDNAYVGYMHGSADKYYIYPISYNVSAGYYDRIHNTLTVKMSKSYTFDDSTGMFSLGTAVDGTYTSDYHNYYTCMSSTKTTCSKMVYVSATGTSGDYYTITGAQIYNAYYSSNYNDAHANEEDSSIKVFLDNWYEKYLQDDYSHYLADAGFCNDRSVAPQMYSWHASDTAFGYGSAATYYGPYYRHVNSLPQFKCPNEERDLFTTKISSKGNKALDYPIGLLTIDEAIYMGLAYGYEGNADFSWFGNTWWLMSPYIYNLNQTYNKGASVLGVYHYGEQSNWTTDGIYDVRPVINLNKHVRISGGNGSSTDPYVIVTN